MSGKKLNVGDYIGYNTNPRLDGVYYAFIHGFVNAGGWDVRIIQMFDGVTLPKHKDYLFNNPDEWVTSHIRLSDIKEVK